MDKRIHFRDISGSLHPAAIDWSSRGEDSPLFIIQRITYES